MRREKLRRLNLGRYTINQYGYRRTKEDGHVWGITIATYKPTTSVDLYLGRTVIGLFIVRITK
jgi:hypothetical protein